MITCPWDNSQRFQKKPTRGPVKENLERNINLIISKVNCKKARIKMVMKFRRFSC